jgi:flagella basal body P-ring formation protein FlgA
MGASAAVRLEGFRSDPLDPARSVGLTAVPEPGSRLERPVRFSLMAPSADGRPGSRRVGGAVAVVHVAVEVVRVTGPVRRGTILGDTDLAVIHSETGPVALAALPGLADVVGGRAVRDLAAGEIVTPALVRAQPLVKSGDTVRTVVRMGPVEAAGQAIAQQSGRRNDRIRLINPESRRQMFGRITGPGEVEVIHVP